MATAELARAGVIVWVSKGGGQMEIVGHEAALMDDSADDAVARITAVLADPAAQERLRHALAARAEMFSTDRFVAVDGGTLVEDTVLYSPIGGALMHGLMVKRDLQRIFTFRQHQILKQFQVEARGPIAVQIDRL